MVGTLKHISYEGAATELGTDTRTVSGLVKALGIKPKKTGLPGRGKGLDENDMKLLREALSVGQNPSREPAPASSA